MEKWYKRRPVIVNERKIFWIKGKKKEALFLNFLTCLRKRKARYIKNGWVKDLKTTVCFGMLKDELIKIYFFLNCHIVEAWWGLAEFRRDKKTDLHWLPLKRVIPKKGREQYYFSPLRCGLSLEKKVSWHFPWLPFSSLLVQLWL